MLLSRSFLSSYCEATMRYLQYSQFFYNMLFDMQGRILRVSLSIGFFKIKIFFFFFFLFFLHTFYMTFMSHFHSMAIRRALVSIRWPYVYMCMCVCGQYFTFHLWNQHNLFAYRSRIMIIVYACFPGIAKKKKKIFFTFSISRCFFSTFYSTKLWQWKYCHPE